MSGRVWKWIYLGFGINQMVKKDVAFIKLKKIEINLHKGKKTEKSAVLSVLPHFNY